MAEQQRRRIIITHTGSEMDLKIALGIILRRIMRGEWQGSEASWDYHVEIGGEPD